MATPQAPVNVPVDFDGALVVDSAGLRDRDAVAVAGDQRCGADVADGARSLDVNADIRTAGGGHGDGAGVADGARTADRDAAEAFDQRGRADIGDVAVTLHHHRGVAADQRLDRAGVDDRAGRAEGDAALAFDQRRRTDVGDGAGALDKDAVIAVCRPGGEHGPEVADHRRGGSEAGNSVAVALDQRRGHAGPAIGDGAAGVQDDAGVLRAIDGAVVRRGPRIGAGAERHAAASTDHRRAAGGITVADDAPAVEIDAIAARTCAGLRDGAQIDDRPGAGNRGAGAGVGDVADGGDGQRRRIGSRAERDTTGDRRIDTRHPVPLKLASESIREAHTGSGMGGSVGPTYYQFPNGRRRGAPNIRDISTRSV